MVPRTSLVMMYNSLGIVNRSKRTQRLHASGEKFAWGIARPGNVNLSLVDFHDTVQRHKSSRTSRRPREVERSFMQYLEQQGLKERNQRSGESVSASNTVLACKSDLLHIMKNFDEI